MCAKLFHSLICIEILGTAPGVQAKLQHIKSKWPLSAYLACTYLSENLLAQVKSLS
jgi:hypothetical protein